MYRILILFFCCALTGCGNDTSIKTVSVSLNQPLDAFDSDDTLSLWIYNQQINDCEVLQNTTNQPQEDDTGFISKDTINADTLTSVTASTSFNIENLPADIPLSFFAIVIDNSTGDILTSGCNEHDAIGAGSNLDIEIILPKTE